MAVIRWSKKTYAQIRIQTTIKQCLTQITNSQATKTILNKSVPRVAADVIQESGA